MTIAANMVGMSGSVSPTMSATIATPPPRLASSARPGTMRLRCWDLANADTRSTPTWEVTARPQRPLRQSSASRQFSKLLQNSRLAESSSNTLDGAQRVLDSLAKPGVQAVDVPDDLDLTLGLPADLTLSLALRTGTSLPTNEKDRFYGSLCGTQVEAELRRLGMLVKGLARDVVTIKGSMWNRQEDVGEKDGTLLIDQLTRKQDELTSRLHASVFEIRSDVDLNGKVLRDSKMEIEDRLEDVEKKFEHNAFDIDKLWLELKKQEAQRKEWPIWGRRSLPDNDWPDGRVPPGRSLQLSLDGSVSRQESASPSLIKEPSVGDEVEAIAGAALAIDGEEYYGPGDVGRVSSDMYIDEKDGIAWFEVTWYRTGLTSPMKREAWTKTLNIIGNKITLPQMGDEVEALLGIELTVEGKEYYRAGDKGHVSKSLYATETDGMDRFDVTWYRTGLTSTMEKDAWLKKLRFISPGEELQRGPSVASTAACSVALSNLQSCPTTADSQVRPRLVDA